ncbi:DUF967 domain-containing protein [Niveomyces insectorum RCEF 264]|uniref:DUF967 domain-containing protein n=1 Tax=Niveomyces insectorum RCEF 264 TaxID=1081102 RepID=A0A162MDF3_9HYPO|nr:DUF967 domain-containing protein [Niveomyces insectorum RCEF 264]
MASLGKPSTDYAEITAQEKSLVLPHFTADDAFEIGISIRNRARDVSNKAAVVNITLANKNQLLFHAASRSGIVPDNDFWVARKRNFVLRFGTSTWAGRHRYNAPGEDVLRTKFHLGDQANDYVIHGGGFPIRVDGVEGIVGIVVVSGLTQEEDHQVIVESLQAFLGVRK